MPPQVTITNKMLESWGYDDGGTVPSHVTYRINTLVGSRLKRFANRYRLSYPQAARILTSMALYGVSADRYPNIKRLADTIKSPHAFEIALDRFEFTEYT